MQYQVFEPEIEMLGVCLQNTYDGFGVFKSLASKVLLRHGLGKMGPEGLAVFEPDGWYRLEDVLRSMENIAQEVGEAILFRVGFSIPKNAVFPPSITTIYNALGSIDIAYHMNHRKKGRVMFDGVTGVMLEGIGHYRYSQKDGQSALIVCENSCPCELDRGLLTSMALRFEPKAVVKHAPDTPCRKGGANSCSLLVTW